MVKREAEQSIVVSISINADEYLRYYNGSAKVVVTQDIQGKSVRFPANILQGFVTREGISGVFEIYFNAQGKFLRVERL